MQSAADIGFFEGVEFDSFDNLAAGGTNYLIIGDDSIEVFSNRKKLVQM